MLAPGVLVSSRNNVMATSRAEGMWHEPAGALPRFYRQVKNLGCAPLTSRFAAHSHDVTYLCKRMQLSSIACLVSRLTRRAGVVAQPLRCGPRESLHQ
jgi:hypothetical protein